MPGIVKKIAYVYKITNPLGQVYVGSTTDFKRRMIYYRRALCRAQKRIYESIITHGWNNHVAEIIWAGDIEVRFQMEDKLGMELNSLETSGGLNIFLPFHCPPLSKESREKVSKNSKRHKPSKETSDKSIAITGRAVIQCDKLGREIKEFSTTAEAARITKIGRSNIKNNLTGLSASAGGYVWKFKDGESNGIPHKKVMQMDMEGNDIREFESMSAAAKAFNIHATSIRFVICRGGKTAAGFKWKYA